MSLTTEEKEEIAEVVAEVVKNILTHHPSIDEKTHTEHHEFMEWYIENSRRRKELIKKTKETVIGWLAIMNILCISFVSRICRKIIRNVLKSSGANPWFGRKNRQIGIIRACSMKEPKPLWPRFLQRT